MSTTEQNTMQERLVRAVQDVVDGCIDYETERAIVAAVLAVVADVDGIGAVIRAHQPTTGMSVTGDITCTCGYWTGNEVAGKTCPVGFSGLQWHQAEWVAMYIRGEE